MNCYRRIGVGEAGYARKSPIANVGCQVLGSAIVRLQLSVNGVFGCF